MIDLRNKMEHDSRFTVDNETMDSLFNNHSIFGYTLDRLAVGKIRRTVGKKIYRLEDTLNYKLITDPNNEELIAEYEEYSKQDNNIKDNSLRSLSTYNALVKQFVDAEYSLKKGAIIVNQYNFIVDGLHRSCILLNRYGTEHIIDVVRVKCKVAKRMYLEVPVFELIQFFKGKK